MKHTTVIFRAFALSASLVASASFAEAASTGPKAALAAFDTEKDGTLSWDEVGAAASARFDAADTDHEGTLDAKEAAKLGISKWRLKKADPDKDGTLDKTEYLAIVKQRFAAADRDHEGTLSRHELSTRRGRWLLRLLQ